MKQRISQNLKLFFNAIIQLIFIYATILLIFAIFRSIILIFFNNSPEIYNETSDLPKAYFTGFRFDSMIAAYGLIPALALNFAGIFLPHGEKYYSVLRKILGGYYTVLLLAMLLISVIDLYFYNFFMTRISVLIFGFIEDDTLAVVKAIWTDYPVIPIIIGLVVAGWLIYKLVSRIQKIDVTKKNIPLALNIVFVPVIIFLFIFAARGTFAFYPLKINDAIISQYVFINNLVPNGVYALKTAIKDKKEQNIDTDVKKTMKRWGFSSAQEAISIYARREIPDNQDSLRTALIGQTPENDFLEQNPPNVIFIQMESMSEDFISFHDKETFNLLGSLEKELPECVHFTHFLSATDATIHTLEGVMLNSPITPISQSIYMNHALGTSAAKPFKEKGYHTAFVTSSKLGWRNLDKFVPHQYFDDVEGSANLEKNIPNTMSNEWGCYDEFMFDRIYDLLMQPGNSPKFVFGMTITNHTPYSLPKTYTPYPVQIPDALKKKLSSGEEHAKIHFSTYQYANDCLGKFIAKIKASPLGENTIIVASGDHTARRIFDYTDTDMLQKYAVPLILYIPPKYRSRLETPDTNQFGSHKDIFPTIYHLALSDAKYVKSGINLFDKSALLANFAIYGYKLVMNDKGCVYYDVKPVFYTWADEAKTKLKPANANAIPDLEKEMKYGKAYTASMTYLIQKDLSEKQK